MAVYTTIDNPAEYFETVLYTGNGASTPGGSGSTQTVSSLDFAPNLVWIKDRTSAHNHNLMDTVRGAPNILMSDATNAEITDSSDALTSFTSNGFVIGDNGEGTQSLELNKSSNTYVAWCWKESATAGFDILTYTGNATNRTISHNLSAVPQVVIVKRTDSATAWSSLHLNGAGSTHRMVLNDTAAKEDDATFWQDTDPTSSVFSLGTSSSTNVNTGTYVAYLFAEKQGFSKFGSYTGNGNADGSFVFCGFRPAFVMIKRTDSAGWWNIIDNKRLGYNALNPRLYPNDTSAEDATETPLDIVSNGFKLRATSQYINYSGATYVYMAFAEQPFVNSNGVPCNAR